MEGLNLKEQKVLYVGDEEEGRRCFLNECSKIFSVVCAKDIHQAEAVIEREKISVLICDNRMPVQKGIPADEFCGLFFLREVRKKHPNILRALVTGVPEESRSMPFDLMNEAGVEKWIDKLEKPPWDRVVKELLEKHILENLVQYSQEQTSSSWFPGVVGESKTMRDLLHQIEKVCDTGLKTPILIVGDSGVGKELVARAIHNRGHRKNRAYHVVSKVETLGDTARDAFFGHTKGAFSGACSDKPGAFEMAHKGTFFIDEVQSLSLDIQADLLRVVELGKFRRLGAGEKERETDFQLICTTNEDPELLVRQGRLREDFYHRINSLLLSVPPLRARKESIPALARKFINDFNKEASLRTGEGKAKHVKGIEPNAFRVLLSHDWKRNNVRELKNTIMSAWINASRDIITTEDLPIKRSLFHVLDTRKLSKLGTPWKIFDHYIKKLVEQEQVNLILWANILSGGNIREAATLLGMTENPETSRVRLHQFIRKHYLHEYIDRKSKEILYECQVGAGGDSEKGAELLCQRLFELFHLLPDPEIDAKKFNQIIKRFKPSS